MNCAILTLICLFLTLAETKTTNKTESAPEVKYRFLAFLPMSSKSHHRVWQPFLRELSERGHHVTYVTPIKLDNPPMNFNHIHLGDDVELTNRILKRMDWDITKIKEYRGLLQHYSLMAQLKQFGVVTAQEVLENADVQKLISSDLQFDAIILETSFKQEIFLALQHKFKAVTIEISTAGNWHWAYWIHGNPYDTNYIVDSSVPYCDKMTLSERIHNTVNSVITRALWYWYIPEYQAIMDQYIRYPGWESRPSLMDMYKKTSLVLHNTHYSLNYPYPSSPNFKEVGGLNLVPPKPLPKDLQDWMDGAKDGVIYFTLGSFHNVSTIMGEKTRPILVKVFSKLKQRVLMKWEIDFPNLPSNIKISKWFPQQDILAHKNMKVFISHGGFLSMTEAVNQGVPILGIPIVGDQQKNIKHVEYNEYGIGLDLENITETSLEWALGKLLNDPKYAKNAQKQSALFKDKPETALETAVFWTEYVIRHKGAYHLRPAIADMPWYQQAMLDVYGAIAAAIVIPIFIIYKLIKFVLCCLCGSSKKSKQKRE